MEMNKNFIVIPVIVTLFFFVTAGKERNVVYASLLDIFRSVSIFNSLDVRVSAPQKVEISRVFKIDANIINNGKEKINVTEGKIILPSGLSPLGRNVINNTGIISGENEKNISWSVIGDVVGSYVVSVSITGEKDGDDINAEGSTKIKVVEQKNVRGKSANIFLRFFSYLGELFLR